MKSIEEEEEKEQQSRHQRIMQTNEREREKCDFYTIAIGRREEKESV